jgi:hypothetical protein
MRLPAAIVGTMTVAGLALAVKAFTIPYAEYCEAASRCPYANRLPTLLRDENYGVNWVIVVPLVAIAIAAGGAIAILGMRRTRNRVIAACCVLIGGVVALSFYLWLPSSHPGARPGLLLGSAGALLISMAGLFAIAFTFPERNPHNRLTVR